MQIFLQSHKILQDVIFNDLDSCKFGARTWIFVSYLFIKLLVHNIIAVVIHFVK